MSRIWVLSELYFPEQTSTGYLLTKTAEGLAEDFDVRVITGPASNFLVATQASAHETIRGVEVFRRRGTSFNKDHLLGRILNMVTRSFMMLWTGLAKCRAGDAILVVTNPPLLPFVALLIKWLKGCHLVLLVHDVYPEVLVASGLIAPSSVLIRAGMLANRFLYARCERIVTLGRDMTRLVEAKLSHGLDRIVCIPNWAENDIVRPEPKEMNSLLIQHGLTREFVVLYAGNMGRTHGIADLANAALQLRDQPVHFLVIGFGAKRAWLEQFVAKNELKNVTMIPPQPRSKQFEFLNACDVALISFVKGMAGVSVPSRMYSQMAAGKPIVAVTDDWSELAAVVAEESIGWVCEPGDVDCLVRTIRCAIDQPSVVKGMGDRAARAARDKYDFSRADMAYKKLFAELLSQTRSVA